MSKLKVRCPICGTETEYHGNEYRPFCSKPCKDRDLGQWATEKYRVPGQSPFEPREETAPRLKVPEKGEE